MAQQKQIGKNNLFMLNFMLPCWNITCYIEHLERLMVQNGLSTLVNVGVSMTEHCPLIFGLKNLIGGNTRFAPKKTAASQSHHANLYVEKLYKLVCVHKQ